MNQTHGTNGRHDDPELVLLFRQHVLNLNLRGARFAGILVALLVPMFSILDFFVLREMFQPLLVLRLGVGAIAAAIVIWSYKARRPNLSTALTMALFLCAGLSIVVMVHMHDRLDFDNSPSHYYAGIMLVIVGATLMATWKVWQSVVVFGTIYIAYIVPSLLWLEPKDGIMYLSNNFFLVSTIIVATVGQYFTYGLQQRDVYASSRIEKAAKELESANVRLTELDRYKTQFFANITHELKTPLTLILAPTEAIIRGEIGHFSESQQEYFRRIYQNGLKLMKLISDLLDLARLEESKVRLRIEEIDLNSFLSALVSDIRPLAERKGISIAIQSLGPQTPVYGDRQRLEQIFVNLLSNAVKFTGDGGSITVILTATRESVKVDVVDTGIGIPEDKLDLIFDRFSQVDGSSTRKYGGTGIGLALARELVELHGGSIKAASSPGTGTTVTTRFRTGRDHLPPDVVERRTVAHSVSQDRRLDGALPEWWEQLSSRAEYRFLPVDEVSERRLAPRSTLPHKEAKPRHRILIVEDSRDMLQFLQLQLREEFELYLADDGSRGWQLVQKLMPDLVVTDYMMPEMDGRELTSKIKSNPDTKHIPVVMLTAKTDVDSRIEGRQAGADEYLGKPFSCAELVQIVRCLLKTRDDQAHQIMSHKFDSLQVVSARMAHEIHNPLNYIRNGAILAQRTLEKLLELCATETPMGSHEESLARKQKLVERLNSMINQIIRGTDNISLSVELLREYSREGYQAVETLYDASQGLKRVIAMIAAKDGTHINVNLQVEGSPHVWCVPQEFHEVFSNLLQNAMDASHKNGNVWITCSAHPEAPFVHFTVQDDGEGIPPENLSRVFTPMFSTKPPGQGMGMGLAIVQKLVVKAGATIEVSSTLGQGTTFFLRWPSATRPL